VLHADWVYELNPDEISNGLLGRHVFSSDHKGNQFICTHK